MSTHDPEAETRKTRPHSFDEGGEQSLCFVTARRTHTVPLPSEGSCTIGRASQADIRLDDDSVSRCHARVDVGDALTLEDLGSRNGTQLRDRILGAGERAVLRPGDIFFLGEVLCLVQGALSGSPRRTWPAAHLAMTMKRHCARRGEHGDSLTLLLVRAAGASRAHFEAGLLGALGPDDLVSLLGDDEAHVLLCGRDATEAEGIIEVLRERLGGAGDSIAFGIAVHPRHGADAAALVRHAEESLRSAMCAEAEPAVVVRSPALRRLHEDLARVAKGTISVLLLGEPGVGKEIFASQLHALSPRASKPFVKFNCAALAPSLAESELFGYEKGAFTGAAARRAGLIESAAGGTVFLDEVGELPPEMQAKLLRTLEARSVRRVGAASETDFDVRFVAATNRDLDAECAAGRFRRDLLDRLNGVSLKIPPLRERPEEIDALVRKFLARFAAQAGLAEVPALTSDAFTQVRSYPWPGNIRELRNVIERAVLLHEGGVVTASDLRLEARPFAASSSKAPRAARTDEEARPSALTLPPVEALDLSPSDLAERARIIAALARCTQNQSKAARELGFSRKVLINRMERYGLPRPQKARDD